MFKKTVIAAVLGLSATLPLQLSADCAIENNTEVKLLAAGFEAWKAVAAAMEECGNVEAELDQEFKLKQPSAFSTNPSLYHLGGVSNESILPLLQDQTIRPLDDLIEKYGQNIKPNQLIKIDGKTMAVAMMVNSQHLMYRQDIFDELGLDSPTTFEELLAAAEKIKQANIVEYPIGATFKTGWNLAMEFVNTYMGFGGSFISDDSQPTINNESGVKALETLKSMTAYMDPEYLVSDSTYVQQQFQQGKIAMANLWASRAGAMDDEKESEVVGKVAMAATVKALAEGAPASTLWWDGIVVAKNISDEEAEAAFQVLLEGIDAEMANANPTAGVWLIEGYEPGPLAQGAIANAMGKTPSYPASAEMGMMVTAIGNNVSDFLIGNSDASKTLADIEAEYLVAAKEKGIL